MGDEQNGLIHQLHREAATGAADVRLACLRKIFSILRTEPSVLRVLVHSLRRISLRALQGSTLWHLLRISFLTPKLSSET